MMNRHPVPSLDSCLSELLHEEKRIVTQAAREHRATVIILVIRTIIIVYMILGFLSISSEKCGIWRLYGDLKRILEKSSASTSQRSNVVKFSCRDVPTSQC